MDDCKICTDDGYKINREGYTLCKQHYEEVEDVFKQKENKKKGDIMDTTITEVYQDYIKGGMSEEKAAKICLGVQTMGFFDAIEEPMRTDMIQDFINKRKRSNK